MKTLFSFLFVTAISVTAFSQSNKPEKGLGLSYGLNFFGNTTHGVRISYWTKKNIEYGLECTFYYGKNTSIVEDSVFISTIDGLINRAPQITTGTLMSYGVNFNPIILYHLPTKNNLDLFVGGVLPIGFNNGMGEYSVEKVTDIPNFFMSDLREQSLPKQFYAGLQFTAGTNYFFYDNLAIGASFRLGYNRGFSNGKTIDKIEAISSGANNPDAYSIISYRNELKTSNTSTSFGFNGSALFILSYYFSRDKQGSAKD